MVFVAGGQSQGRISHDAESQLYAMALEGEFLQSHDTLGVDGMIWEPIIENLRTASYVVAFSNMPARGDRTRADTKIALPSLY